ncbi:MAG: PCMD domain-containing protein [Odoribacter sp.]
MKKLFLFALICTIGFLSACSDDDDNNQPTIDPPMQEDGAYRVEGEYKATTIAFTSMGVKDTIVDKTYHLSKAGDLLIKIKTPFIVMGEEDEEGYLGLGNITIDSIPLTGSAENYSFKANDFTTSIEGAKVNIQGTIQGKVLTGQLVLTTKEKVTLTLSFDAQQIKNNENQLLKMTIDNKVITQQPTFVYKASGDFDYITFYVKPGTDISKIELSPMVKLSKGAISNPANGEIVDFSNALYKGKDTKYVVYNIVSEDFRSTRSYKICYKQGGDVSKNSFENWILELPDNFDDLYKPTGQWATSNHGIGMVTIFPGLYDGGAIVLPYAAGKNGKAAQIITAYTTGQASFLPGVFPSIPVITSGSLFLGDFIIDVSNTLNSTQFGIPYYEKPKSVKGYFKYTPGEKYYYCPDLKNSHIASLDPNKTDECALSAILYEVDNYENYLNGETISKSDKVVAFAQLCSGTQDVFKEFELKLDYKKAYDPAKKYRFAVIFSSSKDGDKFSGADGSSLVVDEVELINE